METSAVDDRARTPANDRVARVLGHPIAYLATAAILFALFSWPFVGDPDRVAPTKDPAFYTWRTEALLTEKPITLLEIEGPQGMFAAGYRVTAPVIGALLRRVGAVSSLHVTVVLMVVLPVLISLVLAGFASRRLGGDPIMWHSVAFAAAGLLLTPPFVGYLDNVLCLFWLAAALYFIEPSRDSWAGRIGLFLFLVLAGLTHPTTLAIFCATLGLMAALRLVTRRFDVRKVLAEDGWMLGTGIVSAVATVAIWSGGIWGKSVSLSEAALPPPYGPAFFIDRMVLWVDAMRPTLNGPLFLIGIAGLVAAGWRALDKDLTRAALLWLAPLVGLFGFLIGFTYPYYRFFNTTLAWVLLVGLGAGFAIRFFIDRARGPGLQKLTLLGVLAVVVILGTNLSHGFAVSGWTKAKSQWLEPEARPDLDELREALAGGDPDRPVVFVIDDEPPEPFQIYGFSKLSGNTSRYGLPGGQIDRGYLYLGSVANLFEGEPTRTGDKTYDDLSAALLEDTQAGIDESGQDPVIVVADIFNPAGANIGFVSGEKDLPGEVTSQLDPNGSSGTTLWMLKGGLLYSWTPSGLIAGDKPAERLQQPSPLHIPFVLIGLILLLMPGYFALRYFLPDAALADALGLVPALALGVSALVGTVVVAIYRQPFGAASAWTTVALAVALSFFLRARRPRPA